MCNFALILLRQHCTFQNSVKCCPRGYRQLCIKNILRNAILILLGQRLTDQNSMQCCSRGSRQHWIRENPVQFCLNTLGTTLDRSKLFAMLSEMFQTTLHKKKVLFMLFIWIILDRTKPYAMLWERLQTTLYKKKSCPILSQYSTDNI